MDTATLIALILSGLGALGGLISVLAKSRTEAAAQIVTGYGSLCDDLREQVKANNDEVTKLRGELAEERRLRTELRGELDGLRNDQERWLTERADMTRRIEDLEAENKLLRRKIETMQKEYCVGG